MPRSPWEQMDADEKARHMAMTKQVTQARYAALGLPDPYATSTTGHVTGDPRSQIGRYQTGGPDPYTPGRTAPAPNAPWTPTNGSSVPVPGQQSPYGPYGGIANPPLNDGLGFADGGPIHGPGGPRDDNLLIAASNGEYIIPADVVRAKGTEFFDRLKDSTREKHIERHGPATIQGQFHRMADGGPIRGYADGGPVYD